MISLHKLMDFITKKIGVEKLDAYIGHSEGTTQFFIGETLLPEYYKKHVNIFVGMAPVVRLDHTTNQLLKFVANFADQV